MQIRFLILLLCFLLYDSASLKADYYEVVADSCIINQQAATKIYASRIIAMPGANIEIFFTMRQESVAAYSTKYEFELVFNGDTVRTNATKPKIKLSTLALGKHILSPRFTTKQGDVASAEDILIEISNEKMHVLKVAKTYQHEKQISDNDDLYRKTQIVLYVWTKYKLWIIALTLLLLGLTARVIVINYKKKQRHEQLFETGPYENSYLNYKHEGSTDMSKPTYEALLAQNELLKRENAQLQKQMHTVEATATKLKDENSILSNNIAKLNIKEQELENLQRQKDDLLALMLHDIKNPISIIKSLVELLTSYDMTTMDQTQIISEIAKSTTRIIALSKDISRVLILEKPELHMEFTLANVNDIAKDIFLRNKIKAVEKMQSLTITIADEMPNIEMDIQKVDEMIDNLLSNAIKFTHKKGNINVSTRVSDGNVLIEIKDDGLGLSDEDLANLFRRGKKLSNQPTAGEDSTGFGLWIVKKLAEAHGGHVYVKSRVGIGSTFSVSLPIKRKEIED